MSVAKLPYLNLAREGDYFVKVLLDRRGRFGFEYIVHWIKNDMVKRLDAKFHRVDETCKYCELFAAGKDHKHMPRKRYDFLVRHGSAIKIMSVNRRLGQNIMSFVEEGRYEFCIHAVGIGIHRQYSIENISEKRFVFDLEEMRLGSISSDNNVEEELVSKFDAILEEVA